jgi:hypothetical protein
MSESNSAAVAGAAADAAADTGGAAAEAAAAALAAGGDAGTGTGGEGGGDGDTGADATAAAAAATAAAAADAPKPKRGDRHIAHLTARTAAETLRADEAERRAAAAEALLAAGTQDPAKPAPVPAPRPATDVETRAAELVAQRAFNTRLSEIDAAGKKEMGADAWETAKATLTGLGAAGNQAFLQALAETENPAKIFAAMADDTDALMDLLTKPPAAMAAKLGRMDAELSKPAAKPLSGAPRPAAKVEGAGVLPAHDLYNYPPGMSMQEYGKLIDAALPPHLGGKRKVA